MNVIGDKYYTLSANRFSFCLIPVVALGPGRGREFRVLHRSRRELAAAADGSDYKNILLFSRSLIAANRVLLIARYLYWIRSLVRSTRQMPIDRHLQWLAILERPGTTKINRQKRRRKISFTGP